jgi:hypothetical protein
MNYWLIAEPVGDTCEPVWMIYSDDAIIAEYWNTWERQGTAYNKANNLPRYTGISASRCIDDWVVVHWAVPATAETLQKIISAPKPR